MKRILLIVLCVGMGLTTGSWFVLHHEKQPEEESYKDGSVIARHVGISVSNTAAMKELVRQLPFSEALENVSIDGTRVTIRYGGTEQSRTDWLGKNIEQLRNETSTFLESRLSKVIMHHTLGLFLSVSDLSELQITYRDSSVKVAFEVERPQIENYTPPDIERAASSANRFNRVVVEDYVLVDSRRAAFFQTFESALKITFK
ncbi:hypothetical protein ACWS7L_13165 [Exiguobacterium artemiae]